MPAFEGLFPCPYDNYIQTLLYRLAEWHALAKLRMHTDTTLAHLESATATLGREVRGFVSRVCSQFDTIELPKEAAARARRQQAQGVPQDASTSSSTRRLKTFNLNTYKLHALADYVKTIRLYGTVDSYTTKLVRISTTLLLEVLEEQWLTTLLLGGALAPSSETAVGQ